jgi:hypothetical protein
VPSTTSRAASAEASSFGARDGLTAGSCLVTPGVRWKDRAVVVPRWVGWAGDVGTDGTSGSPGQRGGGALRGGAAGAVDLRLLHAERDRLFPDEVFADLYVHHGRRRVRLRDLSIAGRPVVLVWRKRLWRCSRAFVLQSR